MTNQGTDKSKPKTPKLLGPKSKRNETNETKPKTPTIQSSMHNGASNELGKSRFSKNVQK